MPAIREMRRGCFLEPMHSLARSPLLRSSPAFVTILDSLVPTSAVMADVDSALADFAVIVLCHGINTAPTQHWQPSIRWQRSGEAGSPQARIMSKAAR